MLRKLDLGCGQSKIGDALGVDISPNSAADIIWDLNKFPYPFEDDEFDLVYCRSIIEHLDDVTKVMDEIHRITKSNGEVTILTPHFSSKDALADPTHKHTFSSNAFDHLIPASKSFRPLSKAKFEKIQVTLGLPNSDNSPKELLKKAANRFPGFYEKHFLSIFPVKGLCFRLKVLK